MGITTALEVAAEEVMAMVLAVVTVMAQLARVAGLVKATVTTGTNQGTSGCRTPNSSMTWWPEGPAYVLGAPNT